MTRKEEIKQAAFNNDRESLKENQQYFIEGAEWADENPNEKMIAKYLYEKKGYPIDLNGNLPSFDETMKDAEKYLKDKDKIKAEIERRIKALSQINSPREQAVYYELKDLLSFIKTMQEEPLTNE